jgi:4-hydroxy-3-methylbut-2-enyl diphosphate reductase IspH
MSSKVQLVQYSEKAIAVFGDTKPYINELKELGGKFNPALTRDNEKCPGWIYPKKTQDAVQELVTRINAGIVKGSETSSSSKSYEKPVVDAKIFMALVSRVERLEQEIKLLHEKMGITGKNESVKADLGKTEISEDYENEEDEEPIAKPRLMKRK